ncbi:hypothetical protein DFS34DRAFT_188203 [Phlyctochytrium arcticum]|nr:hypothetical protein DFS34DRAFT_188203 [Phlyctochytrium arcticum]
MLRTALASACKCASRYRTRSFIVSFAHIPILRPTQRQSSTSAAVFGHAPALEEAACIDPNLVSSSNIGPGESGGSDRFTATLEMFQQQAALVPLPNLLFLLMSPHHGTLSPEPLDALYKLLVALPPNRFVFRTKHYNSLLQHLLKPYIQHLADPIPNDIRDQAERYLEDMATLGITWDGWTYALKMLLEKDSSEALQAVYKSVPDAMRKRLPIIPFNLLLHDLLRNKKGRLSKSGFWEIYTAMKSSAAAKADIQTYELLLLITAELKDAKVFRRILLRIGHEELEWRSETFAAVFAAIAECGDEKVFNRFSEKFRKSRLPVTAPILTGILRYYLYAQKPRAVLNAYHRFTERHPLTLTPTSGDTFNTLFEACALMHVLGAGQANVDSTVTVVSENIQIIREIMQSQGVELTFPSYDFLLKCYHAVGLKDKAMALLEELISHRGPLKTYTPSQLYLRTASEILGTNGNLSDIERFFGDSMMQNFVVSCCSDGFVNADDDGSDPFEFVSWSLISAWVEGGRSADELMLVLKKKRIPI